MLYNAFGCDQAVNVVQYSFGLEAISTAKYSIFGLFLMPEIQMRYIEIPVDCGQTKWWAIVCNYNYG